MSTNDQRIEARRWLSQAKTDFAVVQTLRAAGHFAAGCFHAQQSAEKALKAVLFDQGNRVVLGHSVRDLAKRCEVHDPGFGSLADDAALLDQFYIPTRYPNGLPSPTVPSETYSEPQVAAAEEAASKVLRMVEAFLSAPDPDKDP